MLYRADFIAGTRPPEVPEPTEPGYYWLRVADARFVTSGVYSGLSWDLAKIRVVLVQRMYSGDYCVIGNEADWNPRANSRALLEVIPIVAVPE